ncbi:MAG: hypothetical protein NTX50_15530 [Candidatus Sumerlaeota bacterium]|nr:hypothetical protein [Candidatus Sumerlaeota bacterium]
MCSRAFIVFVVLHLLASPTSRASQVTFLPLGEAISADTVIFEATVGEINDKQEKKYAKRSISITSAVIIAGEAPSTLTKVLHNRIIPLIWDKDGKVIGHESPILKASGHEFSLQPGERCLFYADRQDMNKDEWLVFRIDPISAKPNLMRIINQRTRSISQLSAPTSASKAAAMPTADANLIVATNIARKYYQCEPTLTSCTQHRAILATFARNHDMGNVRTLLLKEEGFYPLSMVSNERTMTAVVNKKDCPPEDIALLFSEETFQNLAGYGNLFTLNAFAPSKSEEVDYPSKVLPVAAKHVFSQYSIIDKNQWKEMYYTLKPLVVVRYHFKTNVKITGLGGFITDCSVYMEPCGLVVCHVADGTKYVD